MQFYNFCMIILDNQETSVPKGNLCAKNKKQQPLLTALKCTAQTYKFLTLVT